MARVVDSVLRTFCCDVLDYLLARPGDLVARALVVRGLKLLVGPGQNPPAFVTVRDRRGEVDRTTSARDRNRMK